MPKRFDQNAGHPSASSASAELVRHALAEVLSRGDIQDEVLASHVVTIPEVRMSPDLKLATAYVMPLGGKDEEAVSRRSTGTRSHLRQEVARRVNLKFAPELRFRRDETFDEAARIDALLRTEKVARDTARPNSDEDTTRSRMPVSEPGRQCLTPSRGDGHPRLLRLTRADGAARRRDDAIALDESAPDGLARSDRRGVRRIYRPLLWLDGVRRRRRNARRHSFPPERRHRAVRWRGRAPWRRALARDDRGAAPALPADGRRTSPTFLARTKHLLRMNSRSGRWSISRATARLPLPRPRPGMPERYGRPKWSCAD